MLVCLNRVWTSLISATTPLSMDLFLCWYSLIHYATLISIGSLISLLNSILHPLYLILCLCLIMICCKHCDKCCQLNRLYEVLCCSDIWRVMLSNYEKLSYSNHYSFSNLGCTFIQPSFIVWNQFLWVKFFACHNFFEQVVICYLNSLFLVSYLSNYNSQPYITVYSISLMLVCHWSCRSLVVWCSLVACYGSFEIWLCLQVDLLLALSIHTPYSYQHIS